jgi:hypothetical protein
MKQPVPALILSSVMVVMAGSLVNVWSSAQNDAFRFEITPLCDQIVIASRNLHKRANSSSSSVRRKKEFLRNGIIGVCPA